MEEKYKLCLWKNFAASIDMLAEAIRICPEALWKKEGRFFYTAYHTAIFLDFYLTFPVGEFRPVLPYILVPENQIPTEALDDVLPQRPYNQQEVISALKAIRLKLDRLIGPGARHNLMEKWIQEFEVDLHGLCPSLVEDYTLVEILFYNFRHVQHHVGQLNLILREKADRAADWISQAE
jgi:hypothetical protein